MLVLCVSFILYWDRPLCFRRAGGYMPPTPEGGGTSWYQRESSGWGGRVGFSKVNIGEDMIEIGLLVGE